MRTVTFQSILAGALDLAGLDIADQSDAALESCVRKINRRVRKAWTFDRWPEICPVERRLYRSEYASGTEYLPPTALTASEVFFSASLKYYQALRDTTGNPPATLVGGVYMVNAAYWAESSGGYAGNDWVTGVDYPIGTIVRNPGDGRYYSCYIEHTSGGSIDLTKFGILTPFAPYIALAQPGQTLIGEVLSLNRQDPRVWRTNPGVIRHTLSAQGIVPLGAGFGGYAPLGFVGVSYPSFGLGVVPVALWVEFRLRPPVFTSVPWASGTAYVAGAVTYLNGMDPTVAAPGECYLSIQNGTNQNPASSPAYWTKIDFPQVLADFTLRAAGSDLIRADGNAERADREQGQAYAELGDVRDIEFPGQGLSDTVAVQTY